MTSEDKPTETTAADANQKGGRKKCRGKGMGTLLLKGKKYQARVFVNGKLYTKSTKTSVKKDAEKILADFVADFQTKDEKKLYDNLAHRAMTFQQQIDKAEEEKPALTIANTWITYVAAQNRPDSGDRTMSDYQFQFGKFQDWMNTNHPEILELRKVTQEIADEFATELGTTKSPNTFNKYITLFRTIWETLRKTAKLTTNPWMPIRKKLLTTHTKRELTVEELYRVVTTATGELQVLFAIGIYTGLRLGDCAMLEWGSIDLVKSIITVSPRKTSRRNGQKSIRIPLHPALANILVKFAPKKHIGYVLPETAELYSNSSSALSRKIQNHFIACGIRTSDKIAHLCKHSNGYHIEYEELDENGKHKFENTGLTNIVAARKLLAKKIGTDKRAQVDVGFHSLRHTFVSLCGNNNVPMALVQTIVGHSNPAMTEHYFHANDDDFKKATVALPDVTVDCEAKELKPNKPASRLDTFKALVQELTPDELKEARSILSRLVRSAKP